MSSSRLLRIVGLGLISLWGVLVLVVFGLWLHEWIDGLRNPELTRPLENRAVAMGLASLVIQLAAALQALGLSAAARLQWMQRRHGQIAVGLFSAIALVYALGYLWLGVAYLGPDLAIAVSQLIVLLPLVPAWWLLRRA